MIWKRLILKMKRRIRELFWQYIRFAEHSSWTVKSSISKSTFSSHLLSRHTLFRVQQPRNTNTQSCKSCKKSAQSEKKIKNTGLNKEIDWVRKAYKMKIKKLRFQLQKRCRKFRRTYNQQNKSRYNIKLVVR